MIKLILAALLLGSAQTPQAPHPSIPAVLGRIFIPIAYAAAPTTTPGISEDTLASLVARYARIYGVREASMLETIKCEALRLPDGTYDATAQSGYVEDGLRENSWGLAQINLGYHPEVSLAQAQDPDFSVHFMAEQFAAGHAPSWTCYREKKAAGII